MKIAGGMLMLQTSWITGPYWVMTYPDGSVIVLGKWQTAMDFLKKAGVGR